MAKKTFNPGGRPKSDNKRQTRVYVYFNDVEKKKIDELSLSSNYKNLSEFIRNAILGKKINIYYKDKSKQEIIRQLAKIGTNINQIAHRLNIDNAPRLNEKDIKILIELKKTFDEIEF